MGLLGGSADGKSLPFSSGPAGAGSSTACGAVGRVRTQRTTGRVVGLGDFSRGDMRSCLRLRPSTQAFHAFR